MSKFVPAFLRRYEQEVLNKQSEALQVELDQRQATGQPARQRVRSLNSSQQQLADLKARFRRQRTRLLNTIRQRWAQRSVWQQELATRQAARDAVDTDSLCRERDLEKDQIMLDLQLLLISLHDWVRCHYLAPASQLRKNPI